jgi:hypothetical protein
MPSDNGRFADGVSSAAIQLRQAIYGPLISALQPAASRSPLASVLGIEGRA